MTESILLWVVLVILLIVLVVVGVLLWRKLLRVDRETEPALMLLQNQLNAVQQRLDSFAQVVQQSLQTSSSEVGQRLEQTGRVVADLREKVGQIEEVGRAAVEMVQLLRAPKQRGIVGELALSRMLAETLPVSHYVLQYGFRSGDRVDAVIRVGEHLVPVDAKFPLESYQRAVRAATEADRVQARRAFQKDVQGHIEAITKKYIRPEEGTFDFALMYVPAESVYYEILAGGEEGNGSLFQYALKRHVIPVSPGTFYSYLQTILLGLRGLQIEAKAKEILGAIQGLQQGLADVKDNLRTLGTHLRNAVQMHGRVEQGLSRLEVQLAGLQGSGRAAEDPAGPT